MKNEYEQKRNQLLGYAWHGKPQRDMDSITHHNVGQPHADEIAEELYGERLQVQQDR